MLDKLTGETQRGILSLLRRTPHTVTDLAVALGLTDNAIRTHLAALSRDGLVEAVGTHRDTGGKPARLYGVTREGGELFPKAYALALNGLVQEIIRTRGSDEAVALLRRVGAEAAAGITAPNDLNGRVALAAETLRSLGADLDVQHHGEGWELKGYACPLSAVTSEHPAVCSIVTALVSEITGKPVTECCDRSGAPKCGFRIAG